MSRNQFFHPRQNKFPSAPATEADAYTTEAANCQNNDVGGVSPVVSDDSTTADDDSRRVLPVVAKHMRGSSQEACRIEAWRERK
eukprot:4985829-Lingulodinium_polyedra.AAC.1